MNQDEYTIVNRVATSSLISLDLEDYLDKGDTVELDIAKFLDGGLILREKEFRSLLKNFKWESYKKKNVAIVCSCDAIIPSWAYMLIVSKLSDLAHAMSIGGIDQLERRRIDLAIEKIDVKSLENAKVVVKGCGSVSQRDYAYTRIAEVLIPLVGSLMYGEPCSTVPVYKKSNKAEH